MFREYFLYYKECTKDLASQYEQSLPEVLRNLEPKRRRVSVCILIFLGLFVISFVVAVIFNKGFLICISGCLLLALFIALLVARKYDNDHITTSRFEKMIDRINYVKDLNDKLKTKNISRSYLYPVKNVEHYESLKDEAEKERDNMKNRCDNSSKIVAFVFSVIMTVGIENLTGNELMSFSALIIAYGIVGLLFNTEITEKVLKPYNDFIDDVHDIVDYENGYYK